MKKRVIGLVFFVITSLFLHSTITVNGLEYFEKDSGIYVEKQRRCQITLSGETDPSYFVIYFNASGGKNINWKISVLDGGSFQLYFMQGHVDAELMLSMMGGLYMKYLEGYSKDTDVKSASDSFYNNGDDTRFTIFLLNEGNEDVELNVDVSISKSDVSDLKIFLYCCGALFLFILVPSIIVSLIKLLTKKGSKKDDWRVVAGDISNPQPNSSQDSNVVKDTNRQSTSWDGFNK